MISDQAKLSENLVFIPNAKVINESIYSASRLPVLSLTRPGALRGTLASSVRDSLRRIRSPEVRVSRDCIWVTDDWSHNYYHWILDVAPKIEYFCAHTGMKNFSIALPQHHAENKFVQESLDAFKAKIVKVVPGLTYHFSNLIGVKHLGYGDAALWHQIKKRFFVHFGIRRRSPLKIYISRADTDTRRIANESSVTKVLKKLDFSSLVLSKLRFRDQLEIFHNARIITGMHGAGLVNTVFSSPGSAVLEFRPSVSNNICFEYIASKMSLNHYLLKVDSDSKTNIVRSEYIIDIGALREHVEVLCRSPR